LDSANTVYCIQKYFNFRSLDFSTFFLKISLLRKIYFLFSNGYFCLVSL
jgi:hypothetical protein